jgi:hypothetical protein
MIEINLKIIHILVNYLLILDKQIMFLKLKHFMLIRYINKQSDIHIICNLPA